MGRFLLIPSQGRRTLGYPVDRQLSNTDTSYPFQAPRANPTRLSRTLFFVSASAPVRREAVR